MNRDEELRVLGTIDVAVTREHVRTRTTQLFESNAGARMLVDDTVMRDRENAVRHCVRIIESIPSEVTCFLGRKEQLGNTFEPLRLRAIAKCKEALATLEGAKRDE